MNKVEFLEENDAKSTIVHCFIIIICFRLTRQQEERQ